MHAADQEYILYCDKDRSRGSSGDLSSYSLDVSVCSGDPADPEDGPLRASTPCSVSSVDTETIIQAYEDLEKALPR